MLRLTFLKHSGYNLLLFYSNMKTDYFSEIEFYFLEAIEIGLTEK
jgi:hypothetical protein